jgi:Fibronectin type III domain
VVGALVLTEPDPRGGAAGWARSERGVPAAVEAAEPERIGRVDRTETAPGLAGLPPAARAPSPSAPSPTSVPGATSTTSASTDGAATVPVAAGAPTPVPGPAAPPTGGELAPANTITMVLAASGGTTTAHVEWNVTAGAETIGAFELAWSCCGARQGAVQLPAGARSHDLANLTPGTSYVVQLAAIRPDGTIDASSAATASFTTAAAPATTTPTTAPAAPKPVPTCSRGCSTGSCWAAPPRTARPRTIPATRRVRCRLAPRPPASGWRRGSCRSSPG